MKVAFIGVGTMGGHMAANVLKAGHELIVFDVRRATAEPLLVEAPAGPRARPRRPSRRS